MKAYTAVQKKLLVVIYSLWKKDEAFETDYQDKYSTEVEPKLSLASVSKKPVKNKIKTVKKTEKKEKVTLAKTKVTQDKHPSKNRRMLSLA